MKLEQLPASDLGRIEAVWHQRAVRLSRRPVATASSEIQLQVLVLGLGTEHYGLELADVAEVLPALLCTPVPCTPPAIVGVINVHGEIRPVMDLKLLLGIRNNSSVPGLPSPVVLLRRDGRVMGLQVDRVEQIRTLTSGELRSGGEESSRYLKGLTLDTLMLLSTGALFSELLKDESAT